MLQKELHELKGVHHITQLRAEKQNEWNERVVSDLKDEIQVSRKLMKQMISLEQYTIDLDHIKAQSSATMVYCSYTSLSLCKKLVVLKHVA